MLHRLCRTRRSSAVFPLSVKKKTGQFMLATNLNCTTQQYTLYQRHRIRLLTGPSALPYQTLRQPLCTWQWPGKHQTDRASDPVSTECRGRRRPLRTRPSRSQCPAAVTLTRMPAGRLCTRRVGWLGNISQADSAAGATCMYVCSQVGARRGYDDMLIMRRCKGCCLFDLID